MKKTLALFLHHGGTAPDLINPSLEAIKDLDVVTFYILSPTNHALNKVYEQEAGRIGPAFQCKNEAEMVQKALQYNSRTTKFDGVLTFAEMLLESVSQIAAELGLKFLSTEAVKKVQNKKAQRDYLKRGNVPIPKYREITSANDLEPAANAIGFPSVLKPNLGGGGLGVFKVNNLKELHSAFEKETLQYKNIIQEDKSSTFNLEELMIGVNWHGDTRYGDYGSVESVVFNHKIYHLCVSDRTPLAKPFRETGFISPSTLPEYRQKSMFKVAEQAINALGIDNSACHIEMKFTQGGPKIIEVNARLGGTVPFRILNATNGKFDLFQKLALLAVGDTPSFNINFSKYAASKVALPPVGTHVVRNIDFQDVQKLETVDLSIPIASLGQTLNSFWGLESILGLFYLSSNNVDTLLHDMIAIDTSEGIQVSYE